MKALILNNTVVAVGEPITNDRGILQIGNVEYQNCTAVDCDVTVQSGATYDGTTFVNPKPIVEVPQEVTIAQGRAALIKSGIMPSAIDAIIATMPSPQKELADNAFHYEATWKRTDAWVSQLAPLIPLTDLQIDDLFILAGSL